MTGADSWRPARQGRTSRRAHSPRCDDDWRGGEGRARGGTSHTGRGCRDLGGAAWRWSSAANLILEAAQPLATPIGASHTSDFFPTLPPRAFLTFLSFLFSRLHRHSPRLLLPSPVSLVWPLAPPRVSLLPYSGVAAPSSMQRLRVNICLVLVCLSTPCTVLLPHYYCTTTGTCTPYCCSNIGIHPPSCTGIHPVLLQGGHVLHCPSHLSSPPLLPFSCPMAIFRFPPTMHSSPSLSLPPPVIY